MSRTTACLLFTVLLGLACSSGEPSSVEVPVTTEALAVGDAPVAAPAAPVAVPPAPPSPAPAPVSPARPPVAPPAIVAKDRPKPPATPARPAGAFVTIEGDAREVLLLPDSQGAQRSSGGDTTPGAYKVKAWFKQPVPVIAANITLQAGERVVLSCSSSTKRCEKRQAE